MIEGDTVFIFSRHHRATRAGILHFEPLNQPLLFLRQRIHQRGEVKSHRQQIGVVTGSQLLAHLHFFEAA